MSIFTFVKSGNTAPCPILRVEESKEIIFLTVGFIKIKVCKHFILCEHKHNYLIKILEIKICCSPQHMVRNSHNNCIIT